MNEQNNKTETTKNDFTLEDFELKPVSSAETIAIDEPNEEILTLEDAPTEQNTIDERLTNDPIFAELAAPRLPALPRENRARLQMQSPTKLYFYWSIKQNPFQTLNRAFGGNAGSSYTLIAKLINQTNDREEIFPLEAEGATWFDADAGSRYKIEIGFYAVNRPFVRVMFSNSVETPRKNPSPRRDYSPNFAVSANQFAEVLDVSGFRQDAFEVALAGDDIEFADAATQNAFSQIIETAPTDYDENRASEIRFVLLALASGYAAESLREYISSSLFAVLQSNAGKLSAEKALAALQNNFGIAAGETVEEESYTATIFGASLINFPRFSRRRFLPKFSPISSLSARYF